MKNRAPRYSLHKSSGQAIVRIDGRQVYLGRYGSPESQALYQQILAGESPTYPAGMSVASALIRYMQSKAIPYYQRDGAPTKQFGRVCRMVELLREHYGLMPLADFKPRTIKELQRHLADRGWKRTYINSIVGCVFTAWSWLETEELVPEGRTAAMREVGGIRRGLIADEVKRVGVTWSQAELATWWMADVVRVMCRVQYLCAMRPSEVAKMRGEEIDRTSPDWTYSPREHKTAHHGHQRVIALPVSARTAIEYYLQVIRGLQEMPSGYLFRPVDAHAPRLNRASSLIGEHYTAETYSAAVRRACLLTDGLRWTPYQLRHGRGTEIELRFGRDAARAFLGHRHAQTTARYAHGDAQRSVELARKLA